MAAESETAATPTLWDAFLQLRDEQRENTKGAPPVIKGNKLAQETNQQGLMKWYLHPAIKNTVLSTFMFFEQEIPPGSRSGRIRFQGGQVMIILEGKGYTLVDGVKHFWEGGDVVNHAVRANVRLNVGRLKASEPILAEKLRTHKLRIVGARYDLDTGRVDFIA